MCDEHIDVNSREVFFVGDNGQGKSNLLESVYCLAYGSSFRTRSDADMIKKGGDSYHIRSLFRGEGDFSGSVDIFFDGSKKKIVKNGKSIKDRRDLITTIPCVVFCHGDLQFILGEPERRRFFLDQCLSMYDLLHLDAVRNYGKILKSRNLCLREGKFDLISSYDFQLAHYGVEVQSKRENAVFRFNQFFGSLYESISGVSGVSIRYVPSWKKNAGTVCEKDAVSILEEKRTSDENALTTTSGPHRDRIRFEKNGEDFIKIASTGQIRLLSVLLRVAQSIFFRRETERLPILLFDDVLLELDPEKRQAVMANLPEYEQLFCTFLPGEPWERYAKTDTKVYTIKNGAWK